MQTVRLAPGNESPAAAKALDAVALAVAKGKRTVLLIGAGISTNAGIPDFRSSGTGLYSSGSSSSASPLPPTSLKGPDLFSASVYASPDTTAEHLRFIAYFKRSLDHIEQRCFSSASSSSPVGAPTTRPPTATHDFMRLLKKRGKLQRVYTQNIDGLEGVGTGLVPVALEGITPAASLPTEGKGKGKVKVEGDYAQLHGSVHAVRCTSCAFVRRWTDEDVEAFEAGEVGVCPECEGKAALRSARGQRTLTSLTRAYLRPSIVLYSEPTPPASSFTIGALSLSDLSSSPGPDVMLVMGTSLRIPGFKKLVKEFSKCVASKGGVRVLVNREEIGGRSEWKGVFDYEVIADTDDFVTRLVEGWKRLRPQDWAGRQATLGEMLGSSATVKKGVQTESLKKRQPLAPLTLNSLPSLPAAVLATPAASPTVQTPRKRSLAASSLLTPSPTPSKRPRASSSSDENVTPTLPRTPSKRTTRTSLRAGSSASPSSFRAPSTTEEESLPTPPASSKKKRTQLVERGWDAQNEPAAAPAPASSEEDEESDAEAEISITPSKTTRGKRRQRATTRYATPPATPVRAAKQRGMKKEEEVVVSPEL